MKRKPWLEVDDDFIRQLYPDGGHRAVAAAIKKAGRPFRSSANIMYRAKYIGVRLSDEAMARVHREKVSIERHITGEITALVEMAKQGPEFLPPELGIVRSANRAGHNAVEVSTGTMKRNGHKVLSN